ncbi:hypothetical protein HDV01_001504 [Terramyces sp. JEL0728]|nr:hypothetical protein HDV01_001504 [Terramyces sp. JEL0728]
MLEKFDTLDVALLSSVFVATFGYLWYSAQDSKPALKPVTTATPVKIKYASAKDSLIEKLESLGHERMVVLFFGSQTGTAEDLATRTMKTISNKLHIPGVVIDTDEYNMEELAELHDLGKDWLYGFFMATYGEGEPTDNSADFYSWIMDGNGVGSDKGDQDDHMTDEQICGGLNYFVFGLGNKTYEHFNAIAKRLDARLAKLGATRVGQRGEGDDDDSMEGDYLKWEPQILNAISEYFGVAIDTTSQKSKPHVPLFQIEYVDTDPKFKGELSSGQPRSWSNDIETNAKSSYDIKHPYYSKFAISEPLFKNASDSFKFPGHKVSFNHSKVSIKDDDITIPRQCYHIEFDLGNSGIKYKTGDHIGVYGNNSLESVEYLAKGLKIDSLDKVIKLVPNPDNPLSASAKPNLPMPCTLRTALTNYLDINAITKQHQLEIFAKYAKDAAEKKLLEALSDNRDKYVVEVETQQKTLADILHEFPSIAVSIRYYSISSSSKESPKVVSVTAVVVRYVLPHQLSNNGKRVVVKEGLVTSFLERIHDHKAGKIESHAIPASEHIPKLHYPVYIRSSNFRLPKNLETPVVMVGPGTGVAPFRGFIRERFLHAKEGEKVGPTWLFYGCRNADSDYLYKEEFKEMLDEAKDLDIDLKIITAFSRDTDKKVYVQHCVKEHAENIWNFLETQNGNFYICGDAKNMAHDVNKELENIAVNVGSMDEEGSKNWIKKLRSDGRYLEDVWTVSQLANSYDKVFVANIDIFTELISEMAEEVERTLFDLDQAQREGGELTDEILMGCDQHMIELIELKERALAEQKMLTNIQGKMQLGSNQKVSDMYAAELQKGFSHGDITKNEEYKRFRSAIYKVRNPNGYFSFGGNDSDDELNVVGQSEQIKCPLTQAIMVDPYTAPCRHSYSKAIFELFRGRTAVSCPVSGCRQSFSQNELKQDLALKKRIAKKLKEMDREREDPSAEELEDDFE